MVLLDSWLLGGNICTILDPRLCKNLVFLTPVLNGEGCILEGSNQKLAWFMLMEHEKELIKLIQSRNSGIKIYAVKWKNENEQKRRDRERGEKYGFDLPFAYLTQLSSQDVCFQILLTRIKA